MTILGICDHKVHIEASQGDFPSQEERLKGYELTGKENEPPKTL